jgi:hypothetical protein
MRVLDRARWQYSREFVPAREMQPDGARVRMAPPAELTRVPALPYNETVVSSRE